MNNYINNKSIKEIKIKIPLSSANLACGFDTFGIALALYNIYTFKESDEFELIGFNEKYQNDNNLCMNAYIKTFEYMQKDLIKASIKLEEHIPTCGGCGSSANVILAGVIGANYLANGNLTMSEICDIACKIEGHPDNVVPELYGGLTSAIKLDDGSIKYFKYNVNENLIFTLLVPSFSLNTKVMRQCLPKEVKLNVAIYNLSRCANVPYALEHGNIDELRFLLKDKIHQEYRIDKIENARLAFDYAYNLGYIPMISGSGASLLIISKDQIKEDFKGFKKYSLKPDNEGVKIYE